ncbi:MAG: hypothetical protein ABSF95_05215 [Verrucomicrobiota bacterium]|jgi:hypothetical protein
MKTALNETALVLLNSHFLTAALGVSVAICPSSPAADTSRATPWQVGRPIVTYWAGPPMTDATARQMSEGGWNLVWCGEKDLDLVRRYGLRGQLQDPLLAPASLEVPAQREKLDALIARVRAHPALYAYFITDEPNATNFPALGQLVAYLRRRDPAHLAYINLFPTYASNQQLGNQGDTLTAYQAHLRQYVDIVKPALISYDHYQFTTEGDSAQYFLNLALIRQAALDARLPFLNIVQACTWTPSMRVPKADEIRYLVYTTLAYGAQGISYYVYCCPGHTGGIAHADGTPTPLYETLKALNRQFAALALQLQPLRSLGVYHAGMLPPGAQPLPKDAPFTLDPPLPAIDYKAPEPVKRALLGCFGPTGKTRRTSAPTHLLVVNLDYQSQAVLGIRSPARLEVFDEATGRWSRAKDKRSELRLPPGGGKLVRLRR